METSTLLDGLSWGGRGGMVEPPTKFLKRGEGHDMISILREGFL